MRGIDAEDHAHDDAERECHGDGPRGHAGGQGRGELHQAGQRYQKIRDENNRRHAQEWTELLRNWKLANDQFVQTSREIARTCE